MSLLVILRKLSGNGALLTFLKQPLILRKFYTAPNGLSSKKMPKGQDLLKGKKKQQNCIAGPTTAADASAIDLDGEDQPVLQQSDNSVLIKILAKPGSKQNSITGLSAEGVAVQIAAPPVDGQANAELIKFISKCLGVRKSDVSLDKGNKSRHKILIVDKSLGLTQMDVVKKLESAKDA